MKFPPSLKNNRAKKSLRKPSLPLDCCGRFGADIVDDAVDAGNFVDDTRRDSGEDVVRESAPFGGHEVDCRDGAHDDRVLVRSRVPHDADAAHGEQYGKGLRRLAIESGGDDLVDNDRVRLAQTVERLLRHGAKTIQSYYLRR